MLHCVSSTELEISAFNPIFISNKYIQHALLRKTGMYFHAIASLYAAD